MSPNGKGTPEALEAYGALVSGNCADRNKQAPYNTTPTNTGNQEPRVKRTFDFPQVRSSLSESGRDSICAANQLPNRLSRQRGGKYGKAWTSSPLKVKNNLKVVNKTGQQCEEAHLSKFLERCDLNGRNSPAFTVSDIVGTSRSTLNSDSGSQTTMSLDCSTPKTLSFPVDVTPLTRSQEINNSLQSLALKPNVFERSFSMFENSAKKSLGQDSQTNCSLPVCASDISPYVLAQMKSESNESPLTLHIDESASSYDCYTPPPSDTSSLFTSTVLEQDAGCSDDLAVPPPLPPRIPLRQSTVNVRPAQRRYPLPSDPVFPQTSKLRTMSDATARAHRSIPPVVNASCELPRRVTRSTDVNMPYSPALSFSLSSSSSSASSSFGSEQQNVSNKSDDSVFPSLSYAFIQKRGFLQLNQIPEVTTESCILSDPPTGRPMGKDPPTGRPMGEDSLAGRIMGGDPLTGRPMGGAIKSVKLNAAELGIDNQSDIFWVKQVTFDLPNCVQLDVDTMRQTNEEVTRQNVALDLTSYEDIMQSALEVEDTR